jgi:uncharacterized RDD family membrane protein YckC
MSTVAVNTSQNVNIDFELAGFERRLPAWIIDLVIRFVYLYVTTSIFRLQQGDSDNWVAIVLALVIYIPVIFYYLIFEILMNGQTPGKRLLRIKVISLDGYKPTYMQYVNRWAMRLLDTGFLTVLFFYLFSHKAYLLIFVAGNITSIVLFLSSKKEQRIGDLIANTVVIRLIQRTRIDDTIFVEIKEENYVVTFPQAGKLSDRDVSIIKSSLKQAAQTGKYDLLDNIAYKIQQGLSIQTRLDSYAFLDLLVKDFNYITTR